MGVEVEVEVMRGNVRDRSRGRGSKDGDKGIDQKSVQNHQL